MSRRDHKGYAHTYSDFYAYSNTDPDPQPDGNTYADSSAHLHSDVS